MEKLKFAYTADGGDQEGELITSLMLLRPVFMVERMSPMTAAAPHWPRCDGGTP